MGTLTVKGGTLTLIGGSGGGSVLDRINAGLARAATQPVRVAFAGSSTTAGASATTPANRYVNRLVSMMQAAYPGATTPAVVADPNAAFGALATTNAIHGYNAGEGGTNSANYLTADEIASIVALNPVMMLHMIGANDYFDQVNKPYYKSKVQAAVTAIKAGAPDCVQVLVQSYPRLNVTSPTVPWSAYGDALREIAAADPNTCMFVDLSRLYVPVGVPGADPADLILEDGTHGGDNSMLLLAEGLRLALRIPEPAAPVTPQPDTTAPSVPAGLTATPGNAQVALSWNASTDAVGVTGYRVYRGGTLIASPTGTTYTDTGRTNGTQYSYTVAAADAAGNVSAQSAAVTATPAASTDVTAPTTPTGLTAGTPTETTVPLSWTASTDAVGVTGYRVRRDGALVGSPTSTSYTDTGLTGSTTYSYTVSAVDAAGNESAQTAAVTATTAAPPAQATPLASDNYDRADAGTLGTAPTGQTWVADGGIFSISGGRAWGTGGISSVDVGTGDVDVSVDVIVASLHTAGVVFNTLDGANRLAFYTNGSQVSLAKVDAGTLTALASGGAGLVTAGATHILRAVSKGAVVTCYLNGAQVISYTLTAGEQTKFKALTRAGLRHAATTGSGNLLDNFVVRPAP